MRRLLKQPSRMQQLSLVSSMKSELERTNSWLPFLEGLEASLQRKDFRVETIRPLFRFVDPLFDAEPLSWKQKLRYLFFWHTTEKGRASRYLSAFVSFMDRKRPLFVHAPRSVIKTLNTFLKMMLGEGLSRPLLIPEEWIRQEKTIKERLIEKGKKSLEAIERQLASLPVVEPVQEMKPLHPPFIDEAHERSRQPEEEVSCFALFPYTQFQDLFRPGWQTRIQSDKELKRRIDERFHFLQECYAQKQKLIHELKQSPVGSHDREALLKTIEALSFDGPFFEKETTKEQADKKVYEMRQTFLAFHEQVRHLLQESTAWLKDVSIQTTQWYARVAFLLWPILSDEVVWQDMEEKQRSARQSVSALLKKSIDCPKEEREALVYALLQEEDVRAFLGECTSRFLRQQDLVRPARKHLFQVCQLLSYASFIDPNAAVVRHLQAVKIALVEEIERILMPPSLHSKEEEARFFKERWIGVETCIEEIQEIQGELCEECTMKQLQRYSERLISLLQVLPQANHLVNSFRSLCTTLNPREGLKEIFRWQCTHMPNLGGALLFVDPFGKISRDRLEAFFAYKEKVAQLIALKNDMIESLVLDAPFLHFLVWALDCFVEIQLVKEGRFREEKAQLSTFLVLEAMQLWFSSLPSRLFMQDERQKEKIDRDLLFHEPKSSLSSLLSVLPPAPSTLSGRQLVFLATLSSVLQELFQQGDTQKILLAIHLWPLVEAGWRELFEKKEGGSQKEIQEMLVSAEEEGVFSPEIAERLVKLVRAHEPHMNERSFSLPTIGTIQFFNGYSSSGMSGS